LIALHNLLCRGDSAVKGVIYRLNKLMRDRYGAALTDGMTRTVYAHDEVIYKIPRPGSSNFTLSDCIAANLIESPLNTAGYGGLPIAPRRLVWHKSGIPIIVMEKVETDLATETLPPWSQDIDEQQVGRRTTTGEYVIYDAGCMDPPSGKWFDELIFPDTDEDD
jgi:hypothetical protein